MKTACTVSVLIVRVIIHAAAARGARVDDLLDALGIERALLDDVEARLPHAVLIELWPEVSRRVGDPALGLHIAQARRSGALDIVDYVIRASADLGAAYHKLIRYQRLLHDAAAMHLEVGSDEVRIAHHAPAEVIVPRQGAEFILGSLVAHGRRLTGIDWSPRAVCFAHSPPDDDAEHQRLFRAPVRFGQATTEVVLPREVLALPVQHADPELGAVLERAADAWLARLPQRRELIEQVRRHVRQSMRGVVPSAELIARQMGMTPRTFLRHLRSEGATYQEVLDGVRRDLAEAFLRDGGIKLTELAFLLGFSEVSAFYRAFRRWTGTTPGEYRQQLGAA